MHNSFLIRKFDVIVGSNLFGDILSDLGPACTVTIKLSFLILIEKNFHPFEQVHGLLILLEKVCKSYRSNMGWRVDARTFRLKKLSEEINITIKSIKK